MSIEIRDPIHGSIPLSTGETHVVDSAEFSRLRAIKQLGFADVSFPGATHTRFLHSLGVLHLSGVAFDRIFRKFDFSKVAVRTRFRQILRMGALLHDVGHGPLSHTTEEVMPSLESLNIAAYAHKTKKTAPGTRASHEDYTIKYLTDSGLTQILKDNFSDFTPMHIACLIDKNLKAPDDFFMEQGIDFRPILSQLVSSEIDCDRMDYLERDSYFTGTNYGKFDRDWMIENLMANLVEDKFYLGLAKRAIYTFDDFLISRHHIHLMVYFHHYTRYNDFRLYEHLATVKNEWAQRISKRQPYKVLVEQHNTTLSPRPQKIKDLLEAEGINVIWASSQARLSKYHSASPEDRAYPIFVIDKYDKLDKPMLLEKSTEIFNNYQAARIIDRLYVAPENYHRAEKILDGKKI